MVHYLIKITSALLQVCLKMLIAYLVIDESFIDFVGNDTLQDNEYSMRSLIMNSIISSSFIPLQNFMLFQVYEFGAAFSNPQIIDQLNKFIPTWSVNTLAQAYIESA